MPPATPAATATRRRALRIHDYDLSFLNHTIQAARDARIERHRLNRGQGQRQTRCRGDCAANNPAYQSAAINFFHGRSPLLPNLHRAFVRNADAPTTGLTWPSV